MAAQGSVKKHQPPGGHLQTAVSATAGILWTLYRNYFSGAVALVVPAHTRDAAFQLFCDLRANGPKDRKFVARHVRAFVPHTGPGWLALASTLAYGLTGTLGLVCITLCISVAGIYTGLALAAVGGVVLSFMLAAAAVTLFLTACCSGVFAAGALMSYVSLSTTLAVARFCVNLVFGAPAPAPIQTPARPVLAAEEAPAGTAAGSPATSGAPLRLPTSPQAAPPAAGPMKALPAQHSPSPEEGSVSGSAAAAEGPEDVVSQGRAAAVAANGSATHVLAPAVSEASAVGKEEAGMGEEGRQDSARELSHGYLEPAGAPTASKLPQPASPAGKSGPPRGNASAPAPAQLAPQRAQQGEGRDGQLVGRPAPHQGTLFEKPGPGPVSVA